jgi:hypothetical protein
MDDLAGPRHVALDPPQIVEPMGAVLVGLDPHCVCLHRLLHQSCHVRSTSAFAINVEGDFVSMDSDGVTLNWTTANATAGDIHYIALRIG